MTFFQSLILLLLPVLDAIKVDPGSPVLVQKGEPPATKSQAIKMTVLVEALCPGCIQWIQKGLKPMMQDEEFKQTMDVELVWYGNGHQDENDMPVCQHGVTECVGNAVMECSKKLLPKQVYLDFMFCTTGIIYKLMFEDGEVLEKHKEKATKESSLIELNKTSSFLPAPSKNGFSEQCAMKFPEAKAKWDEIKSCVAGDDGLNLLRRGAQITMSTNHVHTPWVATYERGLFDMDWKIFGAGFQHQPLAEQNPAGFICEKSAASLRPSSCTAPSKEVGSSSSQEDQNAAKPCGKDNPCFFSRDKTNVCLKGGLKPESSITL